MAKGEPFAGLVSGKLKQLAALSLVLGLAAEGLKMVGQAVTANMMDLQSLLMSEKIAGVSLNYEMDLTFLLVFALLRLLSYVFRYGEELQQLSDETL